MSWFNSSLSIGSCLDKFFISKNLVTEVEKCEILPCFLSDHDYVNLLLQFDSPSPQGLGVCKFNNSLLNDELCSANIRDYIVDLDTCRASFDFVKA